jgi:hypothetical protein
VEGGNQKAFEDGRFYEHFAPKPTPTPTEVKDWEKEFDLRKKNWQTDFKFWESDIKSFIRNLLNK